MGSPCGSSLMWACPPAAITTYCLPLISYVIGVACPLNGKGTFHNSLPVSTSKAAKNGSVVPKKKIKPPAVAIGPPRLTDPAGVGPCDPPNFSMEPKGTCQRIVPVLMSTVVSMPHGGLEHGRSDPGACRNRRYIPYGAPACAVYSPSSTLCAWSSNSARGMTLIFAGRLLVFTTSR